MTKNNEEENEDFCKEEYFNFEELSLGEEKTFWKNFCDRQCIFYQTKIDLGIIFVKASLSQNLEKSGFCLIFPPNFSYKYTNNL